MTRHPTLGCSRRWLPPAVLVVALACSAGAGMATASAAVPASSAATCSGSGCDHQNPYGAGCTNDASVVYDDPVGGAAAGSGPRVRLWYSPSCGTAWASIYDSVGPSGGSGTAYITRNSDGLTLSCQVGVTPVQSNDASCYTNMVYDVTTTSYATGTQNGFSARTANY